jgi:hypothetical protein
MGKIIPYIMDNKSHVWNHQPVYIYQISLFYLGFDCPPSQTAGWTYWIALTAIDDWVIRQFLPLITGLWYSQKWESAPIATGQTSKWCQPVAMNFTCIYVYIYIYIIYLRWTLMYYLNVCISILNYVFKTRISILNYVSKEKLMLNYVWLSALFLGISICFWFFWIQK